MTERIGGCETLEKLDWKIIRLSATKIARICSTFICELDLPMDKQEVLGWISVAPSLDKNSKVKGVTAYFSTITFTIDEKSEGPPEPLQGKLGPNGESLEVHAYYSSLTGPLERTSVKFSSNDSSFELTFIDSKPLPLFNIKREGYISYTFEQNAHNAVLATDNQRLLNNFNFQNEMKNAVSQLRQVLIALEAVAREKKDS